MEINYKKYTKPLVELSYEIAAYLFVANFSLLITYLSLI